MFNIRNAQLDAMRHEARQDFIDHLVTVIAANYPAHFTTVKESGARALGGRAIDFGAAHGIVSEGGVIALLGLMIQFGESFERSPDQGWAQRILDHETLPGKLKIDFLLERMAGRSQGRIVVTQGNQ